MWLNFVFSRIMSLQFFIPLLVTLIICLSSCLDNGKMIILAEEDFGLELEKQLKTLNKPPIKTIQTKGGDTIDCIDINKQPALDHPLLKNHKVQLRPSSFPASMSKSSPKENPSRIWFRREACPSGTVPIKRTTKKDLIRARSLSKKHEFTNNQSSNYTGEHKVQVSIKSPDTTLTKYFGASAYMFIPQTEWSLSQDQSSSGDIWILGGDVNIPDNVIRAGWMVSPALNGDGAIRLFTYWTGDAFNPNSGCYNTLCPGFVQIDKQVTPNYPLDPHQNSSILHTGRYGSATYDLKFNIFQDFNSGNWWLVVSEKDIAVGYWPKELFTNLVDGSSQVAWGGFTTPGKDGISPPMGTGHFANDHWGTAAYFDWVAFRDNRNQSIFPTPDMNIDKYVDPSGCYGLEADPPATKDQGYFIMYGGPGGNCGVN